MENAAFIQQVRDLIARDDLHGAFERLRTVLKQSRHLTEVIAQTGRFAALRRDGRLGLLLWEDLRVEKNQIRLALLELVDELEKEVASNAQSSAELQAVTLNIDTINISAGGQVVAGNVFTGNPTIHFGAIHTEVPQQIPHSLTGPPYHVTKFLGRVKEREDIHQKLHQRNDPILMLVNGEGGVGKTSLAGKYFEEHGKDYTYIAWLTLERESSIADTLLRLEPALGIKPDAGLQPDLRLEELLRTLNSLPSQGLMVIDNVNELSELETGNRVLRRIRNFHILLTSRIYTYEGFEVLPVLGLPYKEAYELFRQYFTDFEESRFHQFYTAIGQNTLVAELMAKTLQAANRYEAQYSFEELITDLETKGILQIRESKLVQTDYLKGKQDRAETIIGAMYDLNLSKLDAQEKVLLCQISILPAEALKLESLHQLLSKPVGFLILLIASTRKDGLIMTAKIKPSNPVLSYSP